VPGGVAEGFEGLLEDLLVWVLMSLLDPDPSSGLGVELVPVPVPSLDLFTRSLTSLHLSSSSCPDFGTLCRRKGELTGKSETRLAARAQVFHNLIHPESTIGSPFVVVVVSSAKIWGSWS